MKLALISDLHVGHSRATDLNPNKTGKELNESYLDEFERFAKDVLKPHFGTDGGRVADYLLISGDVTHQAVIGEVNLADGVTQRIAEFLGVPAERTFWVPGNHDRCWSLMHAHGGDLARAYEFFPTGAPFLMRSLGTAAGAIFDRPYVCSWSRDDLVVMGVNTSYADEQPQQPHHGAVDDQILAEIRRQTAALGPVDGRPRLLLLHHHPIEYDDQTGYWHGADFSQLQNSGRLKTLLADLSFDLVVHGHRHHPNLTFELSDNGHGRTFICAGSFSATLSHNERLYNQFHIIETQARTQPDQTLGGIFYSWAYTRPEGWTPSRQRSGGIEHQTRFGKILDFETAKGAISEALEPHRPARHVRWDRFMDANQELAYLPHRLVRRVLGSVEADGSWKMHDKGDLRELMLYLE
jgi:3',5'-cyclic AMP phosphodiesterase CpdA